MESRLCIRSQSTLSSCSLQFRGQVLHKLLTFPIADKLCRHRELFDVPAKSNKINFRVFFCNLPSNLSVYVTNADQIVIGVNKPLRMVRRGQKLHFCVTELNSFNVEYLERLLAIAFDVSWSVTPSFDEIISRRIVWRH